LKYVSGDAFNLFRELFKPDYKKGFIVPADTFDNVSGKFPIGFLIWDLNEKKCLNFVKTDVYNKYGNYIGKKKFYIKNNNKRITKWINQFDIKNKLNIIGYTGNNGPDFQNNIYLHITSINKINKNGVANNATKYSITKTNIIPISVYFAVRHSIKATWINDRDQFLTPKKKWEKDMEFQNDCLTFTLFHGQNRFTSENATNHWIPFKEKVRTESLEFSDESKNVFNAACELWIYYQQNPNCNVNASLYDIRAYFQGRSPKGRMNNKSNDKIYMNLITNLRGKLKILAKKIEPKIYEYEFLKK